MKKLALIGNGFDLAHQLKTSYNDFQRNTKDIALDKFRTLVNEVTLLNRSNIQSSISWYSFEEYFEIISTTLFQKSVNQFNDLDVINQEMREINQLFDRIVALLTKYLKNETQNKKITKIEILESELVDAHVISFNYTSTVRLYSNSVFYVHGELSIGEDLIVGFAKNEISCMANGEYTKYDKSLQKEHLNYFRFLQTESATDISKEQDYFQNHTQCLYSGKGDYTLTAEQEKISDKSTIQLETPYLTEYARINKFQKYEEPMPFGNVEEIIIAGHGLESDLLYIRDIFNSCSNLKNVKLFYYNNEPENDINRKIECIQSMKKNIEVFLVSY